MRVAEMKKNALERIYELARLAAKLNYKGREEEAKVAADHVDEHIEAYCGIGLITWIEGMAKKHDAYYDTRKALQAEEKE